jgi:hypothetical protein
MRDTIHGYIQFHAIGLSVMPMVIDFCTLILHNNMNKIVQKKFSMASMLRAQLHM